MNIRIAMLGAFIVLLRTGAIVLAIIGLVWLLADHPVVLFSIAAAVIFVVLTIWFYVGGNAT